MRFGGAYPFSQLPFPVNLYSGHTFAVPPGNYDIVPGRVTILQTFDNQDYCWRNLAGPGRKMNITNSDGYNYRLVNFSGVVSGAAITTAGSSGTNGIGPTDTGCTVSFGAAPSSGRAATGYAIVGGSINTTVTVTAAGTGYLVPPLVVFAPPPRGGVRATGYAVLSGTTIGSIVVTNAGAGYTVAPAAYVVPQWGKYAGANLVDPNGDTAVTAATGYGSVTTTIPGDLQNIMFEQIGAGSGAVLTVNTTLANDGALTAIVITDYGSNYVGTAIPTISFTGAPTSAAATAIMAFSMTSVTVSNAGVAVSVAPAWQSSSGLVQAQDGLNGYYGIKPANGISTLSSTTTTILTSITVEDPGFGLQKVPVIGFMPAGGTAPTTQPAGTAVVGGIVDVSILQPAVH